MDDRSRRAAAELFRAHRRGLDEALATGIVAEDIVVYLPQEMGMQSGTYHGREGYARHIADFWEAFAGVEQHIVATTEHGPWLLTQARYRGTSSSGIPVDQTFHWLGLWRDGRMHRFEVHIDRASAERSMAAARGDAHHAPSAGRRG